MTIAQSPPGRGASARRHRFTPLAHLGVALAASALFAAHARAQEIDGARVYADACAACHGSDGRGRSVSEVGFEQNLPDFSDCDFASREPDADWSAIVHAGGPTRGFNRLMPAFAEALSDAEIQAAIDHLRGFCTDARWPRGELNMPRALFTEKAYPEDEAVVTTSYVGEGPDSLTNQLTWERRIGSRSQIEIGLPFTRADLGDPIGWKSGTGDLSVGVKRVLGASLERGSILSVGGELVLPTGDEAKGFGGGSTVYEASLMYGKLLGENAFLHVQGIVEMPTAAGAADEAALRAALGRTWTTGGPFGRAWSPMLGVLGARELESGADIEWDVVPQFQVSLNKRQHLLAAVGFRVPVTERDARPNELVFYLLWDWYDGGLREGW